MPQPLPETWANVDPYELRLLLDEHIGGPGQYDRAMGDPALYLPLARSDCRIAITFRAKKIVSIEPGPAFEAAEWQRTSQAIAKSLFGGPLKVGRDYSFSSFRVSGSWRGHLCGVQVLPPPDNAPRAPYEIAEHPLILEFPVKASDLWRLTNYRRTRGHRELTLLLNLLLPGQASFQPRRLPHFWAAIHAPPTDGGKSWPTWRRRMAKARTHLSRWLGFVPIIPTSGRPAVAVAPDIQWVQQFYFAPLGEAIIDELSPPSSEQIEEIEPDLYFGQSGHDGRGLRVPTNLDDLICRYQQLSDTNRSKFNRSTFWMYQSDRQWTTSMSSSFASVVSAIEALTERGSIHRVYCTQCAREHSHEVPGATSRFRDFLETYAPGASLKRRRDEMYSLRSGILHGSDLMQLDQDRDFGWDPPGWNERELNEELRGLTRLALRNWLLTPLGQP